MERLRRSAGAVCLWGTVVYHFQGMKARRVRVLIAGTVQGVGFRPHVYRLATSLELAGSVWNDKQGVAVEVEGDPAAVEQFVARVTSQAPPVARIERVTVADLPPQGASARGFTITASSDTGAMRAGITPDLATCDACLHEIFDSHDRRFRYPFTNCTNCGPRFTIVRGTPYDRANTTMAGFIMCPACQAEYDNPLNRRFHAQPNACPVCGPSLQLVNGRDAGDAVAAAARALASGAIVAVKGLGGFHLACRADDEHAVRALRDRKHREDKPFAVMARDLEQAASLVALDAEERALLSSPEHPIVLARRRPDARVADAVAPGHRDLGVMLPYSPLHHLLLADVGVPLVMTSGNVSDEPIAFENDDALRRLSRLADLFLLHNRPIATRVDDSVVRLVRVGGRRQPLMLRRSRGYVPTALPVDSGPALLATGAELKNTFAVAKDGRAWVSHHIGDLENLETLNAFEAGIEHFRRLFEVTPERVGYDLHPDYFSTRYALERSALPRPPRGVQHHHAHLAACLAEYRETGPAVGVIYDGTGYGTDGTIWGGEILVGSAARFERAAHLWPVRLPGGAAAIRQPWRMACAWLVEAAPESPEPPPLPASLIPPIEPRRWRAVAGLARSGEHAPITTSMGRLFDAVAALCGVRYEVNYEGQAAIELEMAADPDAREPYPFPLARRDSLTLLDARPLVAAIARDAAAGCPVATIAGRFHHTVAATSVAVVREVAERHGTKTVVLSGGVFQNVLLLERTSAGLASAGLRVLVPQDLPVNDGGIAFGQIVVALSVD